MFNFIKCIYVSNMTNQLWTFAFLMLIQNGINGLNCENENVCPTDKPFCTDAGCVFECPRNTFRNGTVCTFHCGDRVVVNDQCQDECPETHKYISQTVITTGLSFKRVQVCVPSCPEDTLDFNFTCVNACPEPAQYINDDECVSACPNSSSNTYERVRNERILGVQCTDNCPFGHPYSYNGTCLSRCFKEHVSLNQVCMENCPNNSYIRYELNSQITCTLECPFGMKYQNGTCVRQCSTGLYLYRNGSQSICVKKCPADKAMEYNLIVDTKPGYYLCLEKCPNGSVIEDNNTCIHCEHFIYKDICISACPNDTLLIEHGEDFGKTSKYCLDKCPLGTYVSNDVCVQQCPKVSHNGVCVDVCPEGAEYVSGPNQECVQTCPNGTFYDNNQCSQSCSGNKARYGDVCVSKCPSDRPRIDDGICVQKCGDNKLLNGNNCIYRYKCNTVIYDNMCLDECPYGTYWLDKSQRQQNSPCSSVSLFYTFIIVFSVVFIVALILCVVFFKLPIILVLTSTWRCLRNVSSL